MPDYTRSAILHFGDSNQKITMNQALIRRWNFQDIYYIHQENHDVIKTHHFVKK